MMRRYGQRKPGDREQWVGSGRQLIFRQSQLISSAHSEIGPGLITLYSDILVTEERPRALTHSTFCTSWGGLTGLCFE